MRKNAPRKWLHAVLDLLPVILIPVFMIYSHRHTIDSYEVQYAQNKVVDFNQLSLGYEDFINDITYQYNTTEDFNQYSILVSNLTRNVNLGDKYIYSFCYSTSYDFVGDLSFRSFMSLDNPITLNNSSTLIKYSYLGQVLNVDDLNFYATDVTAGSVTFGYTNFINLTQMFGAGNEPTLQQFNDWYSNQYYSYTESHIELLKGYSTETLNDTDIMSQISYNLYNSVDKYFNMNNIFGFNNLYDWFVLNVFNGNAPLYVYIVWNIILYEFIMDLLFLLYAVFMFLIDVCTHLIEKVFDSGRGA